MQADLSDTLDMFVKPIENFLEAFNLTIRHEFFQPFFEEYLCKMQKKRSFKKNLALAYSSLKKKCKIPLCSKKSNFMKTSPYLQGGALLKRHYNVNPFLQKKIIKLPYSIAILCDFHVFSKYPYLSRFTFYEKVKN